MLERLCLVLRWLARIAAAIVAGGFLFLAIGEILFARSAPTRPMEWFTFGIFLVGNACLILAWKWEVSGSVAALVAFGLFAAFVPLPNYAPVVVAAFPCVLFLSDWLLRHFGHVPTATA